MKITKKEIEKVKKIAYENFNKAIGIGDGLPYFIFNDVRIVNPWIDESGRFDLSDEKAIKTYGLENVINFIIDVLKGVK